jgi:quercetin 2,3-dioxygenase
MQKKIEHILQGKQKHITEEETVIQPLPHKDFRFANPFIVIHHMEPKEIAPGSKTRIHPHPHRGFAPVTFQLQGEGFHRDSAGHEGVIAAGGVQWMFAGKGVLHSEGPTPEFLAKGGTNEIIQIWVNVPAKNKFDAPTYQNAPKETLPQVLQQEGVQLSLASGSYEGQTGPAKSITPVVSLFGKIAKGKRVQLSATPGYWTLLYIAHGSLNINCESIAQRQLIIFEKDNDEIVVTAEEDSTILFLSAEPIDEPVAAKDNFVMNTAEEIEQAFADYKNGLFGTLND